MRGRTSREEGVRGSWCSFMAGAPEVKPFRDRNAAVLV